MPSTGSPPSGSGAVSRSDGSSGAPPRPAAAASAAGSASPFVQAYELSEHFHMNPAAPNRIAVSFSTNVSAPGAGPAGPRPPPPPPRPPGAGANGKVTPVYEPPDALEIAVASFS